MIKQALVDLIAAHRTQYADEIQYRDQTLAFLNQNDDFYARNNYNGHITASAWLVNTDYTQAVLVHHKKLDKWFQPGGHIEDSDTDIFAAALREATEETGIAVINLLQRAVFDIDVHLIPANSREPAHLHHDVRILLTTPNNTSFNRQYEEVKAVQWFDIAALAQHDNTSISRMAKKMKQ